MQNYRCPNCEYVGPPRSRIKSQNLWVLFLLLILSLFFPPLFFGVLIALVAILFLERDVSCKKCGFVHIVKSDERQ